ncbi:MAG: hypothetical protein V8R01_07550 [Bacilli bacterium]
MKTSETDSLMQLKATTLNIPSSVAKISQSMLLMKVLMSKPLILIEK